MILTDQDMRSYLRSPGLSSSGLAYADESMAKYKAYLDGKIRIEGRHLDLGTAVHRRLEDPVAFQEEYIVKPNDVDYRTKAGKAWRDGMTKIVLDRNEMECVESIAENLRTSDDLLLRILRESAGEDECSVFWNENGTNCKCRPDRLLRPSDNDCAELCERWPELFDRPFGLKIVVDYKTTSKPADPKGFYWTAKSFKYPLKAAHYLAGTGADAFLWVVMETTAPYQVTRYLMSPASSNFYMHRRLELLEEIRYCELTNEWPGLVITDKETLI
jgi:hypothetical protein